MGGVKIGISFGGMSKEEAIRQTSESMKTIRRNDGGIEAVLKARKMLDAAPLPKNDLSAWMSKHVFLELGGTQEHWDTIEGDDEVKLVQNKQRA